MKNVFKILSLALLLALGVSCEPLENEVYCDELSFTEQGSFDGDYYYANINANEISVDEEVSYEWKVNGEVQNNTSSYLFLELEEGEYEICVSIETSDCPLGVTYCDTLVVENDDESNEEEEEESECEITTYPFTYYDNDGNAVVGIEIDGLTSDSDIYYEWKIDGEYIDNEGSGYLESTFTENGTYEICVMAETPECPTGVIACETIIIDEIEEEEESVCEITTYPFTNYEYDGKAIVGIEIDGLGDTPNEVYYEWKVDGEYVDNDGSPYLESTFTENGTYEICVMAESPDCPQGAIACETIVIDQIVEDTCDVNIDHTLTYYESESTVLGSFEAYGEAEMFDVENWFMWSVNGEAVNSNYSNVFYYNFSENGTYEICFEPEVREGCEGICKTIVIDQF